MFGWPRFAARLSGRGSSEEAIASLLGELGEPTPAPSATEVFSALFEDGRLVAALAGFAPRVDHVGFVAPPVGVAVIESLLERSPFRHRARRLKSTVLAKELSVRMGRDVEVTLLHASAAIPARFPAVEVFVADLPTAEVGGLVAAEFGCHVALAVGPDGSLDRVRRVLRANGHFEVPLMRDGPLANDELRASLIYVDVAGRERTRRLEFIAAG